MKFTFLSAFPTVDHHHSTVEISAAPSRAPRLVLASHLHVVLTTRHQTVSPIAPWWTARCHAAHLSSSLEVTLAVTAGWEGRHQKISAGTAVASSQFQQSWRRLGVFIQFNLFHLKDNWIWWSIMYRCTNSHRHLVRLGLCERVNEIETPERLW